jgi:RNA polymerase sigma factor (sigma-70 family)
MTTPQPGPDGTTPIQVLLDRMHQGDLAARDELVARLYRRLVRLSEVILGKFPDLNRHEPESILHATWERLAGAVDQARPATEADLFRLAAHKIRQVLLDMVKEDRGRPDRAGIAIGADPSSASPAPTQWLRDSTHEPGRIALWTEFHRKVQELPAAEREVFELHYYAGLSQKEIAPLLGLHPRQVSRLWIAATERLADGLPGLEDLF